MSRQLAGTEVESSARRTFCSQEDAGWNSLALQRVSYADRIEEAFCPADSHQRIVVVTGGSLHITPLGGKDEFGGQFGPAQLLLGVPDAESRLRFRSPGGHQTLQIVLPGSTLHRVAAELGDSVSPVPAIPGTTAAAVQDPMLSQMVRALDQAAQAGVPDLYAETAAEFLAVHLLTAYRRRPGPRHWLVHEDARIRLAVELMTERLCEPLRLADIAGHVGLSAYHFVRTFKTATGQTPYRFLMKLRVAEAQRLLARSELTVQEVAVRCGFGGGQHLWAAIKRETGRPPSDFRSAPDSPA